MLFSPIHSAHRRPYTLFAIDFEGRTGRDVIPPIKWYVVVFLDELECRSFKQYKEAKEWAESTLRNPSLTAAQRPNLSDWSL